MDAKDIARLDQAIAGVADVLPRVWWALFEHCVQLGFTAEQAMELIRQFVIVQATALHHEADRRQDGGTE